MNASLVFLAMTNFTILGIIMIPTMNMRDLVSPNMIATLTMKDHVNDNDRSSHDSSDHSRWKRHHETINEEMEDMKRKMAKMAK